MDPRDSEHVKNFDVALEQLKDERFITREQVKDLAMYTLYLVNLAEADGWAYEGQSLSVGSPMCRLVVRGRIDDIPHVVFTSGRTTMACIHIFLRKLDEGLLEWTKDRFRM